MSLETPSNLAPDRPPHAWGYCRASADSQQITNQAQEEQIRAYHAYKLQPQGVPFGACFKDEAVTSHIPWGERPQGKHLMLVLRPGDHILVAKHDRPFRSVAEAADFLKLCQTNKINLHILNLNVDLEDAYGRFFFHIMMAFAELERSMIGERTKAALQWKKKHGLPYGNRNPPGWVKKGKKREARFVPCPRQRTAGYLIVALREQGVSWEKIPSILRRRGFRYHEITNPGGGLKKKFPDNQITLDRCRTLYKAAKEGFPNMVGGRKVCFPWELDLWKKWGVRFDEELLEDIRRAKGLPPASKGNEDHNGPPQVEAVDLEEGGDSEGLDDE